MDVAEALDGQVVEEDLSALEALVVDNDELEQLEQRLAGFNLFEALGSVRREERHSDFLAFLLHPSRPHGLDDAVLRAFVQAAVTAREGEVGALRKLDVALLDLLDARVEREWRNVDILVTVASERFVLLIENKVDSSEHSNQLARYMREAEAHFPGWRILPVYLTRDGEAASHAAYSALSYSDVHRIVSRVVERRRLLIPTDIEVAVRHYTEMLERHIMEDTRIAELARKIYARHSRALDLVLEHRPDQQDLVKQELARTLVASAGQRVIHSSKSTTHFVPSAWDAVERLREGGDGTWFRDSALLRFEFTQKKGLALKLILGPGDPEVRRTVYEAALRAEGALNLKPPKKLSERFTQLWQLSFYSADDELEDRMDAIRTTFSAFERGALPQLSAVFGAGIARI
jgi:PD-(D/E)XK nuclease superfamily